MKASRRGAAILAIMILTAVTTDIFGLVNTLIIMSPLIIIWFMVTDEERFKYHVRRDMRR